MYFPLFLDLSGKEILVVGAGTIAQRRIHTLCGFAGHMTVVAPEISGKVIALSRDYKITLIARRFDAADLEGRDFVIAATDDEALNQTICGLCRARRIPVNVSSSAALCDFQFPSVVESGSVVIGINASGQDHRLVKETRKHIEDLIGDADFKSKY